MTNRNAGCCILLAAMALAGCASTTWKSYPGGSMKYSEITYGYTALPILKDPAGKTYQLQTDESMAAVSAVPALERRGVKRAGGGADVTFIVSGGAIGHEPGSFGFGPYTPALISTMPIAIKVKDRGGQVILERNLQHEEILGAAGATKFQTREEAKAAMAQFMAAAKAGADAKAKQGAARTAATTLDLVAKDLFEPRKVNVTLPAIRSAGDVDMEGAYALLSNAKSDVQVKGALAAYETLGTEHNKADGSVDVLGNYGVHCGLASAKILSGDLAGAWQGTKKAWELMPSGQEHRRIAKVLKQQEEQAGVQIIPKEEFDEMLNSDKKVMGDQLKLLLGGGKKK